jgi:2-polyprenyl-6-methoxyphenol hydroxylase-like FAD-dependent oxidoreductase
MDEHHELLVIGAGPYGYAAAAYARQRGLRTHLVGRPMSFWRENMPADMFLRSGHLRGLFRGPRAATRGP